ncbi:hypothetical protein D1007_30221 [Hordeum vulgare]|uniref:AT3G52170-like helix-turn-helix domain-containing protein n=1 Tax=Hordeum vulgare subsp. vulgare TaxID=112509 RepID=A0A8I6WW76_HORVV|nr:uncharacterized protein LOC123427305 [Hordeum vulgare subsp. vulgare]KAE8795021.1 hypothetical protein D1007_30221 [Hordeum vulgare]
MHASARFFYSSASSRKVIADISDAVARSSYRPLRGKKHLASLSAQDPPRVQKRLTKEERRARVVEFVENYRASHKGKFPSATYVRKQVGGSYYVSWALLQELEYNSTLRSDNRDASFNSENFKGKYGLNNIDPSTRDAKTSFEGINEEMDQPEVPKRMTKEERRVRIEEFVENFRASHEGKFPHATYVRQQVGGSYYTVLALLQELEYNSRLKNDVKNASFSSENFKEKYGLHNIDLSPRVATTSFQGVKEEMAKTSEPLDLNTKPQLPEGHCKAGAVKPNLSPTTSLEDKSEPMASGQTENNNVVKAQNLKSPKHAHEASKGANLWGSLKSFAGDLRIFWNNL